ncbi:MAG: GCN5-related N-acetyltransferase [Nocardioides sp.]|nr:GCN5-related N-acetyltransferase [Nocardioides sp.]
MTEDEYELEFTEDPLAFLGAADEYLREDPVLTTVVATVTQRAMVGAQLGEPRPTDRPCWWVLVRGRYGQVVSVGMRTAPFAPYPLFVPPMPDPAARGLARALHARGEEVGGVNGALPAAQVIADETAALTGRRASVHEHTRLFELGKLIEPPPSPGRMRAAAPNDLDVCLAWFNAFAQDAAEQAGRTDDPAAAERFEEDDMRRRIAGERVWLWEDEAGRVVHLTGYNLPAFGVVRVGPVYTPREHRGRGYASTTVAAMSRRLLDEGLRACLFTDQANPTSNKIYQALGYEPVVDMANLVIAPASS